MPEAFVSVMAAWLGNPGLALGNGVGSIIADTSLIFGLMCLLTTVPVNQFILNRTGWVQVGGSHPACPNLAYRLGHYARAAYSESMGRFSLPSFPGRLHVHNIRVG
jgi:Ca2+/Na+ antiporter